MPAYISAREKNQTLVDISLGIIAHRRGLLKALTVICTQQNRREKTTMTINEGMKKYRLPNPTTSEDLEMRFSGMDGKILNFGDRVLMAGYYWNGKGQPNYYAAVYELS